jgi:serine/threonine protein phosphatase PrpC
MKRSICLLGRDFPDLGPLGLAALPDGGALALSRGARPKPYPHQDPNEDGALLVRTAQGALLAIGDGYNGAAACELALAAAHEDAPRLIGAKGPEFRARVAELVHHVAHRLPTSAARSRTCLVLARLVGRHCEFASFGDSCLIRSSCGEPISRPNELVLGRALDIASVGAEFWYGSFECEPHERIALLSDGVTNFAPAVRQLAATLGAAASDLAAARALAEQALRGGAGDNVAVCALRTLDD